MGNEGDPSLKRLPRWALYREPGEISAKSSRVMLVFGDKLKDPHHVHMPEKGVSIENCHEFLNSESERLARVAASRVLRNVERQKAIEEAAKGLKQPMRDVINTGHEPAVRAPQPSIGDTVIILGGFTRPNYPPESLALFSGMLQAVPDLANLRGVDIHLEGNDRTSTYASMDFAQRVIEAQARERGRDFVESVSIICPATRVDALVGAARRTQLRVSNAFSM